MSGASPPGDVVELAPGLERWTATLPGWSPGDDWGPIVGSVLYDQSNTLTLIDPLLPADGREEFLRWLDRRVAGRPVSILTTIRWHRRDREQLAERYRANSTRAWNAVPAGVTPRPLRGAGETMYWLSAVAALVSGDRLIVREGEGLRVCPQSWLEDVHVNRPGLAELLSPLLELPIERVVVSHGEPVLHDGRAALAHAIREARA